MSKTKPSTKALVCPSCSTDLLREAKFCHECGAATDTQPAAIWQTWKYILGVIVVSVASAGVMFLVHQFSDTEKQVFRPSPQINNTNSPRQSGPAIDLSTMTPQQAADRLFNRVMAAEERADSQEVMQFAPMALEAYRLVQQPDADVHYHMGLISLALGDTEETRKQLQQIRRYSPNHLLGLHLEFRLAERGDAEVSPSDILKRFAAVYEAEIKSGNREYDAHRRTIVDLRARAERLISGNSVKSKPNRNETGAQLFASNCARCHGADGLGSDSGPPLVHRVYEPSHHDDASFHRAIRQGVKSHHWSYGDMPSVPNITDEQVAHIIRHVRKLQVASGIK